MPPYAIQGKSLPLFFFADCRNIPAQSTIKHCMTMEFQMIEQSAFDEMKTLVTSLRERAERFRELFSPPQPRRWLTAEEVCRALRITKRALQYYRSEGIIPSTSLGNKILYKESDIARILQNNLIAPFK